jgi:hypothetical protein
VQRVGVDRVARNQLIPNKDDNDADESTSLILAWAETRSGMNKNHLGRWTRKQREKRNEKWPLTNEMINNAIKAKTKQAGYDATVGTDVTAEGRWGHFSTLRCKERDGAWRWILNLCKSAVNSSKWPRTRKTNLRYVSSTMKEFFEQIWPLLEKIRWFFKIKPN